MLRIPASGRRLAIAVASALLAVVATGAAADPRVDASAAPTRQAVALAGEFCTSASCRPRSAALLTGAAFGVTVLAIGWRARRGSPREH
jgi:hypothetical protein